MESPFYTLSVINWSFEKKLRQAQAVGQFSNYILLRVVRLTIETNAVTGKYHSINVLSTFNLFFMKLVWQSLLLYSMSPFP